MYLSGRLGTQEEIPNRVAVHTANRTGAPGGISISFRALQGFLNAASVGFLTATPDEERVTRFGKGVCGMARAQRRALVSRKSVQAMRADRFYQLLNLNRVVGSHRLKFAGLLALYCLRQRHLCLRFDPVMSCNLRCQMCYFSDPRYVKEHTGRFSPSEIEKIAEVFFPWALQLYIGCATEPTTYRAFVDIVALGKKYKVPMVGLVSNGQLLTAEHLERLVDLGLDELTLSVHGVERGTYERMMHRASYDKFLDVLDRLEAIKKSRASRRPQLRLNYTASPQNLEELRGFFDVYGKCTIRTLQIRPIIDLGNTECTDKDMRPYAERYDQILRHIERQCLERGIRLLANCENLTYENKSARAALASEALVYLSPERVSKQGFDWRHETYPAYCRRIKWARALLKSVFSRAAHFEAAGPGLSYQVIDQ
jgi:MoaA/NifB/PqqE/SkfB family radical SAM enzyme